VQSQPYANTGRTRRARRCATQLLDNLELSVGMRRSGRSEASVDFPLAGDDCRAAFLLSCTHGEKPQGSRRPRRQRCRAHTRGAEAREPRRCGDWHRLARSQFVEALAPGAGPLPRGGHAGEPAAHPGGLVLLRSWAEAKGLEPSETACVARTPERADLQFSCSGDAGSERLYRTHGSRRRSASASASVWRRRRAPPSWSPSSRCTPTGPAIAAAAAAPG
jgi:hypothetical protein